MVLDDQIHAVSVAVDALMAPANTHWSGRGPIRERLSAYLANEVLFERHLRELRLAMPAQAPGTTFGQFEVQKRKYHETRSRVVKEIQDFWTSHPG